MRLWSIHPKYLDAKGLVALWRETLLAKNVLEGNTKGYKNHPQLIRFKENSNPIGSINNYLSYIWVESKLRNYNFDSSKFLKNESEIAIPVTTGQVEYETLHLLKKLKVRDENLYKKYSELKLAELHPMFYLIEGGIEHWEKP